MAGFRPLVPHPGGSSSSQEPPPMPSAPKRRLLTAACQGCRARKIKCDGLRPSCGQCASRNTECFFPALAGETRLSAMKREVEELKESSKVSAQLFEILRSAPDPVTAAALRHIKSGLGPGAVLRALQSSLSRTPSPNRTNSSLMPPTQSRIEFELAALHPNAYPFLVPLDASTVDLALLGMAGSVTASPSFTLPTQGAPLLTIPSPRTLPITPRSFDQDEPSAGEDEKTPTTPPRNRVAHEIPPICDRRLHSLDIANWSQVQVPSSFAAGAISLYLETEHPVLGLFDVDLFLNDLIAGGTRFCNRMLVNALMSWACQIYTYIEPFAASLSSAFFAEATESWQQRSETDDLPTLSAILLMGLICNSNGQDQTGLLYLHESAQMARRLQLLDQVSMRYDADALQNQDPDYWAAASAVAWSVFNSHMFHSMDTHQQPLVTVPPALPIPGLPSLPGESTRSLPLYMGGTFAAIARFCLIALDMAWAYYSEQPSMTLSYAEALYERLLQWADTLPTHVSREEAAPSHVLVMHIRYHILILDVFRPLLPAASPARPRTSEASQMRAAAIFAASIKQLMRLIYEYRSQHEAAKFSILYHSGMMHLLNEIMHHHPTHESQFYFLLCMKGYDHLARCVPIVGGIVQNLLQIAPLKGAFMPSETLSMFKEAYDGSIELLKTREHKSLDLSRAFTDIESTMPNLIKAFEQTVNIADNTTTDTLRDMNE